MFLVQILYLDILVEIMNYCIMHDFRYYDNIVCIYSNISCNHRFWLKASILVTTISLNLFHVARYSYKQLIVADVAVYQQPLYTFRENLKST